jgi:hypothetical protein
MFCKNCGNEMKDGVKFCDKCGAKNEFYRESASNSNATEASAEAKNVQASENNDISRDSYIGKAYVFDYYIGLNLRSFRISRRAVGFNDDNLLYCKGLRKTQIPYSMIHEIKDETKISTYVIFCIAVFVLVGIICIVCGGAGYALIAAALAIVAILYRKCREVSIVTTDNKVFKIKVGTKNKEVDEFLRYLKNETGIK